MTAYNLFHNDQQINIGAPISKAKAQDYINSCIMNSGFAPVMVPVGEPTNDEVTESEMFRANFKAAVAYVAGELASDQIELRAGWKSNYGYSLVGGGISVVFWKENENKVEAWFEVEESGLKPLGNLEIFKAMVDEYLARVRK